MDIRLFGQLEVLRQDVPVQVRGIKQRTILALLALHRGSPVSGDRLADAIWGDDPPGNPANALQAQVSQLRRTLGPDAITTSDAGYALAVRPDDVDVVRFEHLVASALRLIDSDPQGAAGLLGEALELARDPPLAEFTFAPFADTERARLDELVVVALEARAGAELAVGRHSELVAQLEALCRRYPLREGLWELRMLALYRSGRQADALRAYAEARAVLVDELGIEPGPGLRDLESRILAQDPSLGPLATRSGRATAQAGNLRSRPDRFVGREAELDSLKAALENSALVTLIGPGGVGKTRLAAEAASALRSRHPDGAWMIELAPVPDPAAVASAVAGIIRAESGERAASPEERIIDHVRDRSMLIVLDNCEHVIAAAANLAEQLVAAAPQLRVIVTSREALAVPGEVLLPVTGLPPTSALELFTDRARAARPDYSDADSGEAAEEICARLDGLPLAIELAAARLRALPVAALAGRLDDRFRILTGGARTALPRHQTLRAVVDWSYDLLFDDERRLFARLSVFTGGCDLAAAEEVCTDGQIPRSELVEVLGRLIDKSLVTAEMTGPSSARYTQLQTLWQYGRERLADSGEAGAVRERHARWYLKLADEARIGLRGAGGPEWRDRLEPDLGNLRSALEWLLEQGDAASALTLATSIAWLAFVRADSAEAARWLGDALALPSPAPSALHGLASAWHALHRANLGTPAPVRDESLRAVEELRLADDPAALAEGLVLLSEIYNRLADFPAALDALAEARPLLVDGRDDWQIAAHDTLAAGNLSALDRLEDAEQLAQAGVDRYNAIGERWFIIEGLGLLAGIREARGDLTGAAASYEELVATAEQVGMTNYKVLWTMRLAGLRARLGDDATAEELFATALAASRRPTHAGTALIGRAAAARRLGNLDAAQKWVAEALALFEGIKFVPGVCAALIAFGWASLTEHDLQTATSYARQAVVRAAEGTDAVLTTAAETLTAAIELEEADTEAHRARFIRVLADRAASGAARYARILGGAFAATFDEPDVAAIAAKHNLGAAPLPT